MTKTPEQSAALNKLLLSLVPLFREAALFARRGWTNTKYHDHVTDTYRGGPFASIVDASNGYGLHPGHAIEAFSAFVKVRPAMWCEWPTDWIVNELSRAADSFEAQLQRAA